MSDTDERREFVRVDDSLVVQFHSAGSSVRTYANSGLGCAEPHDVLGTWNQVRRTVTKPLHNETDTVTPQLLLRVDWLLSELLSSLATVGPSQMQAPRPTPVNIAGTGIRFQSVVSAAVDDVLDLMVILPIFMPIRCTAKVIRVRSQIVGDQVVYEIATAFTAIGEEDREQVIQYTFRRQSEILRQRNQQLVMA